MQNARLDESQAGIEIDGRNISTTLMAEGEEKLKSFLMRVKEESENLKLNIRNTKITASGPSTSWQTEGEKVKAVTDFIFLGSKVTVTAAVNLKDNCSLEGKL